MPTGTRMVPSILTRIIVRKRPASESIPSGCTEEERLGEEVFFGKGQCGGCHPAPFYLDDKMHDLKVEHFYEARMINGQWVHAEGPVKTFTQIATSGGELLSTSAGLAMVQLSQNERAR